MTNSEADAKKIEAKLEKLPEVLRVMSLDSFVPEDQPAKLKLIAQAAKVLGPALNPDSVDAAPSDAGERRGAEEFGRQPAQDRRRRQGAGRGRRRDGWRTRCRSLPTCNQATRDKAQNVFVAPLKIVFDQLKNTMQARPGHA